MCSRSRRTSPVIPRCRFRSGPATTDSPWGCRGWRQRSPRRRCSAPPPHSRPLHHQVSQYDGPTNVGGWLDLPSGIRGGSERAHSEEDRGKSRHVGGDGRIHGADYSLVDDNRAGVPLVEIVSRPDLRGSEQAREYVSELRDILLATEVSDARMEEGSMRVDANVSVRHDDDT